MRILRKALVWCAIALLWSGTAVVFAPIIAPPAQAQFSAQALELLRFIWQQLGGNSSGLSANVTCVSGCSAATGTGANNADGVAAVGTGLGQTTAYPFLWNGATFDRWKGDATNGAFVNIKASIALPVTGTFWQATQPVSAAALPLPANAAQETGGNLATLTTDFGAPGATACSTDTASCNLNQQMQRLAQRLSTLNTTLGSPFQAGGSIGNTAFGINQTDVTGNGVEIAPTAAAAAGITPVVSGAAEGSHVFKASAGNLYSAYVTTGATAGFLMIFNATSAPADGAVTPVHCVQAPANQTVSVSFNPGPAEVYATGITAVFSTTGCFTKTISATAFFHGSVK